MAPTQPIPARVLRGAVTPSTLPLDFAERAVRRFGWLALGFALTQVLVFLMGAFVQPGWINPRTAPALYTYTVLAGAALAFLFCALAWSHRLDPRLMLDLALVFEVLASLAISLAEHALPWHAEVPIRGLSSLEVWIAFFVLAVPATFGKSLLAATASAIMGPLGLMLHIVIGAVPSPALSQWITLFVPALGMAVCAAVIARFIYHLTGQVGRLREMGSYRLLEPLNSGGMGEVWIAEHSLLARRVAIKLIRVEAIHGAYPDEVRAVNARFEREARSTAALSSAHTVALYDFGSTDEGAFYLVMELLEGIDLQRLVRDFGPLEAPRAIHILIQVCDSLSEAHEKGIVHRDIKPANIVLSIQGCAHDFVKVLDFGLAKSKAEAATEHLTLTGSALGTPAFMAPETAAGKPNIDGRADIYSLGCVAYYLLTGQLVFPEKDGLSMALAHVNTPAPAPSTHTEVAVPEALDRLILQCLAKDPAARPQTCRQLAAELSRIAEPAWLPDQARQWWEVNKPAIPTRTATPTTAKAGRTIRKQHAR
ncbi:MAG: protein kinase [Acidobacteria bacterium]|nr:protein kinase [Acidobacteriota bacterium]